MRQVTHALLTRPPLSHSLSLSEEINQKCFVRLACVKHAASVHPEPGSNSRNKDLEPVFHGSYVRLRSSMTLRTLFRVSLVSQELPLCAPQFLIWFFQILELSEQHLLSKATPLRGFFSSSIPFRKTTSFPIPLLLFLGRILMDACSLNFLFLEFSGSLSIVQLSRFRFAVSLSQLKHNIIFYIGLSTVFLNFFNFFSNLYMMVSYYRRNYYIFHKEVTLQGK